MKNTYRTGNLLKNTGILTISNFSSKILVFLLVPLYTSVLSTSDFGIYDLAISTATLLFPILTLNIVDAVMRFTMDDSHQKKEVATIALRYLIFSVLIFALLICLLTNSGILTVISGLEIFIILYYITYGFYHYIMQFAKSLERIKELGISGVLSTFSAIILNILFLLVFQFGLPGFFLASIVSLFISALYLSITVKLHRYIDFCVYNIKLQKEMLAYSLPLIITVIGWWVNSTSDRYIVTYVLGLSANGILSIAYKIPQILTTIQSIFIQAWSITAIKEYGQNDAPKYYGKMFSILNFAMSVICSILILLTKFLALLLYSKGFYASWEFVPFLLLSSLLNFSSGFLGPILSAKKDSKSMMWSGIVGSLFNLILNVILVPVIGIQGATLSTLLCSYIIYLVRKISLKNDIEILNYNIVNLTWLLLLIQSIFEIYFEMFYMELLILVMILVINKSLLKEMKAILLKRKGLV